MSIAPSTPQVPGRRLAIPRLIVTFALLVLSAAVFCAIIGFVLVRQADDRQEIERRAALSSTIEDIRATGVDFSALDPRTIRALERVAGLKDLRFETEPAASDREVQSVVDRQGRIVGWFSWEPDRSMTQAVSRLKPLLAGTLACLIGFAGVAAWQVRRAMQALAGSEQLAWTLAHEDMLTGLPNHRKMIELIDQTLAARKPGEVVTLAFIDIDGLNDVNDALGQRAGDALLVAWAERLRDALPAGGLGSRFDGDEFAVLLTAPDAKAAEGLLRRIASTLGRPFWIDGQAVQAGNTLGFAHAPVGAQTRDELIRCADLALRAGKRKQRGGLSSFEPGMDVEFNERRFIERDLKRALDEEALDVHYQPIVTADGARIIGVEALLRWQHPERGAIPPAEFVAVAEHCGLMSKLGAFVLRRALEDAKRWPDISIAINLSPVQVRDRTLVDLVSDLLAESRVAPSRVWLEVTEGVLIDKPDEAKVQLDALRGLGVRLALDDFGTGYSSLSYLQSFKFDKLKIDRSFIAPLGRDASSLAMIQAIVTLGRALDMALLAEGVETEEQRVMLRLAGCEEMQGYLFARPVPREALDQLLADLSTEVGGSRLAS